MFADEINGFLQNSTAKWDTYVNRAAIKVLESSMQQGDSEATKRERINFLGQESAILIFGVEEISSENCDERRDLFDRDPETSRRCNKHLRHFYSDVLFKRSEDDEKRELFVGFYPLEDKSTRKRIAKNYRDENLNLPEDYSRPLLGFEQKLPSVPEEQVKSNQTKPEPALELAGNQYNPRKGATGSEVQ